MILTLVIFLVTTAVVHGDPCQDYVALDEPLRSTGALWTVTGHDPPLCDDGLETKWYRFVSPAGGVIPTTCSLLNQTSCSTLGPVWMNG
ncbi:OIT3 [Branchiostoma lanceolatum]|uniref:OIT3 protein n=1 Tax=Branchiostoma lanceolatum TaxID=7740 RepID=A0A8J9ZTA0_BRALA|nr:OIT3 [Branchiostoma lanceolatum]